MKKVDIVYNPYRVTASISVDDQPVGINGLLANYQTIEFANWGERFFEDIKNRVNDDYSLVFRAPASECSIMERIVREHESCKGIKTTSPAISDTSLERLEALSEISSHVNVKRVKVSFEVYSDLSDEEIDGFFSVCMPEYGFIEWNMEKRGLSEFKGASDIPFFVICSDSRKAARFKYYESDAIGCVMVLTDHTDLQRRNDCFVESVSSNEELTARISEYFDILILEDIIRKAARSIDIDQSDEYHDVVFLLDKTEPTPVINLPEAVELGVDYNIQYSMLPEDAKLEACRIETSDPRVIAVKDLCLSPLAIGKAMIRVYSNNDPSPIASAYVNVEKRNRIKQIDFDIPRAMRVGDTYDIDVSYEPINADNAHEIVFMSSDKSVATVGADGTLHGVGKGVSVITALVGKVSKTKEIAILPRLKKLLWDVPNTEFFENSAVTIELIKEPEDAVLDEVEISISPSSAGVYDEKSGLLQLNHPGQLTLTAKTRDGRVSNSAQINVKQRTQKKKFPLILKIIIGIAVLYLLLKIFPLPDMRH